MKILASNKTQVERLLTQPYHQDENNVEYDNILKLKNFNIYYNTRDNGGGIVLRHNYLEYFSLIYNKDRFNSCLEWCAGPGFIGFTLLDEGWCQDLDLLDCSSSAIQSCNKTIQSMTIQKNVNTFCSDNIDILYKKYDLIVGNPPWYQKILLKENGLNRIYCDLDFKIHKNFFSSVDRILNKNGRIILVEGLYASHPNDFNIDSTFLEIDQIVKFDNQDFWHDCYFLVLKRKGDL